MSGMRNTLIMMLTMTLLMGSILSGIFTWQAIGFAPSFFAAWASSFLSTYIIVLPTVLLVAPVAQRITAFVARLLDGAKSSDDDVQVALAAWRDNAAGHRGEGFAPWLDRLSTDVTITMPLGPFRGKNTGIAAARSIYGQIAQATPRLTYDEPFRVSRSNGTVVIEFADHGTISGMNYSNVIAASFDIKDGKIAAYREYFGDIDPAVIAMMNGGTAAKAG